MAEMAFVDSKWETYTQRTNREWTLCIKIVFLAEFQIGRYTTGKKPDFDRKRPKIA